MKSKIFIILLFSFLMFNLGYSCSNCEEIKEYFSIRDAALLNVSASDTLKSFNNGEYRFFYDTLLQDSLFNFDQISWHLFFDENAFLVKTPHRKPHFSLIPSAFADGGCPIVTIPLDELLGIKIFTDKQIEIIRSGEVLSAGSNLNSLFYIEDFSNLNDRISIEVYFNEDRSFDGHQRIKVKLSEAINTTFDMKIELHTRFNGVEHKRIIKNAEVKIR